LQLSASERYPEIQGRFLSHLDDEWSRLWIISNNQKPTPAIKQFFLTALGVLDEGLFLLVAGGMRNVQER
jgi:hypothetical protein